MSFEEKALELLKSTEMSLGSLITEALRARAYGEVATIAGLAEAMAANRLGNDAPAVPSSDFGVAAASAQSASPSWMRRP
jgi:hypothetical protein